VPKTFGQGDGRELSGDPDSSSALSSLLRTVARAPSVEPRASWVRQLRTGVVVRHYELIRELGRGGFGRVWEARDRERGRRVAFKAVFPRDRGAGDDEELPREAEAAARLSHPNIVGLLDAGRTEWGPYLVLELLRGETLGKRLERGPLDPCEAVRVALEIAQGLAHAHARGMVHRDLAPGNVFLCEGGRVKLLDLGMAHAFGMKKISGGTPCFMAPEQCRGAPEDERTDVFALGVLLYRMLSGALPFEGPGQREVGDPPARELALEEPGGLAPLVRRMLEKDPVDRPRDGAEVLAALSELQQELERAPDGPGSSDLARNPHPRRRFRAVTVAARAAALGWAAWGASCLRRGGSIQGRPPVAPAATTLSKANGTADRCRARQPARRPWGRGVRSPARKDLGGAGEQR
jgi:serine/threonine protein kinase